MTATAIATSSPPQGWVTALRGTTAVVLDSPHSGTFYPDDFGYACDLAALRHAEDTHVEKLYAFAPSLGVSWIEAHFPRSYIDANRALTTIDTALLQAPWPGSIDSDAATMDKVHLGKGLVWRCLDDGTPIYQRLLSVAEVQTRISQCWLPYHLAVDQAIDTAYQRHGYCLHINCHSMPAVADSHATMHPGMVHADFVVGDRDGTAASPALSAKICAHLRACGYSVDYNTPYKGVELVRRYSNPSLQKHSIQIEINRKLYMNETTLTPEPHGFARLQADLRAMVELLLATDPRTDTRAKPPSSLTGSA